MDHCDNSTSIAKCSSLDDLSVLGPDLYDEIKTRIPAVKFNDDDDVSVDSEPSSDEDDFFKYIPETSQSGEDLILTPDYLLTPLRASESFSTTSSFSPNLSPDINCLLLESCGDFEKAGGSSSHMGNSGRSMGQDVNETLKYIASGALKEEIRWKILLGRVNKGQEDVKLEIARPSPTISYDAVQKRNEIREKNKEYARQSRNRVKHEWKRLESENKQLVRINTRLKKAISKMREMFTSSNDILSRHHKGCRECSASDGVCSICSKELDFFLNF